MRLGIPQPRFTYAPSGSSMAARWAICSLVKRGLAGTAILFVPFPDISFFCMPSAGIAESFRLHNAMDEDRRRHDVFRIDGPNAPNLFHLDDGRFCGHGHDVIEISCRQPVADIAQLLCFV